MAQAHWFFGSRTEREIKKRFHELMLIHHPDRGGNLQVCQEIIGQYREALKSCQYTGAEWNGQHQAYRYDETLEKEFEEAMNWAMTLTFCKIELIGSWLWITGKTQPIKKNPVGSGLKTQWGQVLYSYISLSICPFSASKQWFMINTSWSLHLLSCWFPPLNLDSESPNV